MIFIKANIFTYIWSILGSLRSQQLFPTGICRSRKSHWEHSEPKRALGTYGEWPWEHGELFGGLDGMRPTSSTRDGMGEYSEDRFSKPWVFLTLGWGPHGKISPKSVPHGHMNIPTAKGYELKRSFGPPLRDTHMVSDFGNILRRAGAT